MIPILECILKRNELTVYLFHLLQTKWWILPTHHNERVQYDTQPVQCREQYKTNDLILNLTPENVTQHYIYYIIYITQYI